MPVVNQGTGSPQTTRQEILEFTVFEMTGSPLQNLMCGQHASTRAVPMLERGGVVSLCDMRTK